MVTEDRLVEVQQTIYNSKNPTRRWLHRARRDWLFAAIQKNCNPDMNVLEVGPGSGLYLPKLAETSKSVTGLDINQAYLNFAATLERQISSLKLVTDDITNSKLEKNSFNLILCTEVIEHIADSQAALNNMKSLLSSGGVLILSTPQKYSPLELASKLAYLPGVIQFVRMIYGEAVEDAGHINLMTESVLKSQMNKAGFRIEAQFKSGVYLPVISEFGGEWALKLEKWLEKKVRGTFLDHLLWTQYYIAKA